MSYPPISLPTEKNDLKPEFCLLANILSLPAEKNDLKLEFRPLEKIVYKALLAKAGA